MSRSAFIFAAAVVVFLGSSTIACDQRSVTAPTPLSTPTPTPPPGPANPTPSAAAVYRATFTASPSCASALPAPARQRTYTATLGSDGRIAWTGPTLNPPPGHRTISSGTLSESVLSFSVDIDRDPQSDDFHGLWDDMGNGTFLNISGKGAGAEHEGEITGGFNGLFAFYEPTSQPNVLLIGHYCTAADHQFRFARQ